MKQDQGPASGPAAARRCARWGSGAAVAAVLLLAGCGMSVQVQAGGANAATATSASALASPTPTVQPTATPTPTPEPTATPNATATAEAGITQQWSQAVRRVADINSALADLGTKFNDHAISMQQGAGQLQQLDQQAAAVNSTVQALPPLPGANAATVSHYRQSVNNWSTGIHNLNTAVSNNDIFSAPGLANKLEGIAMDLDQQGTNLHLPPAS